jgi:lysophosphatidylcholine acyltransferase/lyso-PAF acetyltransferase
MERAPPDVLALRAAFGRVDSNPSAPLRAWLVLALVSVVPLRGLLVLATVAVYACVLAALVGLGAGERAVSAVTRVAARLVLVWFGFWRIEQRGEPGPACALVVSNHISYLDALLLMASPLCPAFLLKKTCTQVPLVGRIALALGGVAVDREQTTATTARLVARATRGDRGRPTAVFCEGTTSNGSTLLRFRTGAFVPAQPVQPVLLEYPTRQGEFSPAFESVLLPVHVWRMLSQWGHCARVTYLPVYTPSAAEAKDAQLFARNVRACMAQSLGVPTCELGYQDKLVFHAWLRSHFQRVGLRALIFMVRPDLFESSAAAEAGAAAAASAAAAACAAAAVPPEATTPPRTSSTSQPPSRSR